MDDVMKRHLMRGRRDLSSERLGRHWILLDVGMRVEMIEWSRRTYRSLVVWEVVSDCCHSSAAAAAAAQLAAVTN